MFNKVYLSAARGIEIETSMYNKTSKKEFRECYDSKCTGHFTGAVNY